MDNRRTMKRIGLSSPVGWDHHKVMCKKRLECNVKFNVLKSYYLRDVHMYTGCEMILEMFIKNIRSK